MKETHRVVLLPSGRQGDVQHNTTILEAARSLGVDIESICGGRQVCGKCLVAPEYGQFAKHGITSDETNVTPPDAVEVTYAEQNGLNLNECRLSCAAHLLGDMVINVPERSLARKQAIRKAAGELAVEVDPVCRLAYVEIESAELGSKSDWHRIKQALATQHGIEGVSIDPLLLPRLQKTLRDGKWSVTIVVWNDEQVISVYPGYSEQIYGLAVDVGSTTLAGHLCDLRTGEVLATTSIMNPQVRYGEDLMSRVSFGMMNSNGVDRMHKAVVKALNDLAAAAAEEAGIATDDIVDVVLAGNTVMHHLLLGIDPVELGGAPFALAMEDAIDIRARDLGLNAIARGGMVHVLPCIAGHVGADNTAVLLASHHTFKEDVVDLIVDIGTNAEILLAHNGQVTSASSPTGPAFEGAQIKHGQRAATGAIERVRIDPATGEPRYKVIGDERWSNDLADDETLSPTGICGSGIIEAIAEMYLVGMIDTTGLFTPHAIESNPLVRMNGKTGEMILVPADKSANGEAIVVTQQDIRAIQLAKAALYAGVKLLMDHMAVTTLGRIRLAGGFGSYIDPKYAMILGLVPDCDLERIGAVGNAAGDGARLALLSQEQRALAQTLVEAVQYVETAVEPAFQELFVAAMGIPHATDAYPHLLHLLPAVAVHGSGEAEPRRKGGRRRRRAT